MPTNEQVIEVFRNPDLFQAKLDSAQLAEKSAAEKLERARQEHLQSLKELQTAQNLVFSLTRVNVIIQGIAVQIKETCASLGHERFAVNRASSHDKSAEIYRSQHDCIRWCLKIHHSNRDLYWSGYWEQCFINLPKLESVFELALEWVVQGTVYGEPTGAKKVR